MGREWERDKSVQFSFEELTMDESDEKLYDIERWMRVYALSWLLAVCCLFHSITVILSLSAM